jgi:hypothetical protein
MFNIGSQVKNKISGEIGNITEIYHAKEDVSGKYPRYYIKYPSGSRWNGKEDLLEYLTNSGDNYTGQFLTEE